MYLHLGYGAVADYRDIVGVFDLDNVSRSRRTRRFLEAEEARGRLVTLGRRIPAALVVCTGKTFLSPAGAQTLQKRLGEEKLEE